MASLYLFCHNVASVSSLARISAMFAQRLHSFALLSFRNVPSFSKLSAIWSCFILLLTASSMLRYNMGNKSLRLKQITLGNSENMAFSEFNDFLCKTCANHTSLGINLNCFQVLTYNSHLNYFIFFLKLIHSPLSVFSSSLGEFGSHFSTELLDVISLSLGFVSRHEDRRRSSRVAWRRKFFFNLPKGER